MSRFVVELLPPIEYPLVNRFYKQESYPVSVGRHDRVFVVREGRRIIAAVKLVEIKPDKCESVEHQESAYFMRALYVTPAWRHQGIASLLLNEAVLSLSNSICYCFPFASLQDLYKRAHFSVSCDGQLPADLRAAYRRYCEQGKQLIVMSTS